MTMTVKEWRESVAGLEARAAEIKEERAACSDPARLAKLRSEAQSIGRMRNLNRRHLAIAEGIAARAEAPDGHTPESRIVANTAAERERSGELEQKRQDMWVGVQFSVREGDDMPADEAVRRTVQKAVRLALLDSGRKNIVVTVGEYDQEAGK